MLAFPGKLRDRKATDRPRDVFNEHNKCDEGRAGDQHARDWPAHSIYDNHHLSEHSDSVSALPLIADHDARPLHLQFEATYGDRGQWSYLWRVKLQRGQPQVTT